MSSSVLFLPSSPLFLTKQACPTKGSRTAAAVRCRGGTTLSEAHVEDGVASVGRRHAMAAAAAACGVSVFGFAGESMAVKQGLLAGRIPGLSDPDEKGWRTYRRPDDKSGGHGVGWSPIIPYSFKVPDGWEEVPVSIADLGGTEIDLRFANTKQGRLSVVVAPVRRFAELDDATIEKIGPPEKVIDAFGPEVIGENVEGKVVSMETAEYSGRTYYQFELEAPHIFITATAAGNRLYLFNVTANGTTTNLVSKLYGVCSELASFFDTEYEMWSFAGLQWKRNYNDLKKIAESFRVV